MNKQAWALALTVGLLGATSAAQGALSPPVDGMVYDDVLDLCWLQDAGVSGPGTWDAAVAWAETLEFGGHTDWRLARMSNTSPTVSITFCDGTNEAACRTSGNELGYMFFHNLGGSFPLLGNQGPFLNIPLYVWSGTEYSADDAWALIAGSGNQDNRGNKGDQAYGWAVRTGQCRAAPAGAQPIPAVGVWGLGVLGLLLAGVVRARLR